MHLKLGSMLRSRFLSPPQSKKGFLGALFFFYAAVRIIFDFWQGVDFAVDNASSLVDYLATGPGNLLALVIGVFLIVWAVYSQRSKRESPEGASEAQPTREPRPESVALQPAPADADSLEATESASLNADFTPEELATDISITAHHSAS